MMYRDLKEGTWRSFEEQKPDQEQKIECKVLELWRVAGAHQLLPVKHPAPSIFNSCTGSTATSALSPTKVLGIMYYLGGREATGLDFDKLFHAYCFVANLSVLLFPMSHMYNFVKHHQNTERKLRARSSETSLGQELAILSELQALVRWWPETGRVKPGSAVSLRCRCWITDFLSGKFVRNMKACDSPWWLRNLKAAQQLNLPQQLLQVSYSFGSQHSRFRWHFFFPLHF